MRIACIIPTYNNKSDLFRLLNSLEQQTASFDIFIIDSNSSDGTQELAKSRIANFTVIPSAEFNHGGTRQQIVDRNPSYDIYVFLTQDALLSDINAISNITKPFLDSNVGAVCGRQLPHSDASPLAQHARFFNYPPSVRIKSIDNIPELGIKTAFISNSFAAYRGIALKDIGGFPIHVIFAEDMYAAAKMLMAGWKVAYAGNAVCQHSHNYTATEEFQRYFDMGVFHAREPWISRNFGGAGNEGLKYVLSEIKFLGWRRFYLLPSAIIHNAAKLLGYKLGKKEKNIPINIKKKFSMYKRYWDSSFK